MTTEVPDDPEETREMCRCGDPARPQSNWCSVTCYRAALAELEEDDDDAG